MHPQHCDSKKLKEVGFDALSPRPIVLRCNFNREESLLALKYYSAMCEVWSSDSGKIITVPEQDCFLNKTRGLELKRVVTQRSNYQRALFELDWHFQDDSVDALKRGWSCYNERYEETVSVSDSMVMGLSPLDINSRRGEIIWIVDSGQRMAGILLRKLETSCLLCEQVTGKSKIVPLNTCSLASEKQSAEYWAIRQRLTANPNRSIETAAGECSSRTDITNKQSENTRTEIEFEYEEEPEARRWKIDVEYSNIISLCVQGLLHTPGPEDKFDDEFLAYEKYSPLNEW